MAENRPTVRPMRPADAAAVIRMAGELATAVSDPKPLLSESDFIRDATGSQRWFDCLVAELEGHLVGFAILCKGFEAHTGHRRIWLGDLYVQQAARHGGVARALMASIARHALELGCEAVYWELWRANVTGADFYRKIGAEQADELAVMRLDRSRLAAMAES